MSETAHKLTSIKRELPFGNTEECLVDEYNLKQGPYTISDRFGKVETGEYADDFKTGPFKIKDDNKEIHGCYFFNQWHGIICRYENKQLREKSIYIKGYPFGSTRQWDEHGSLIKLGRHDRDGHFTGVRISYHNNQVPRNITFYEKDQPHGLDVWFDERGVVAQLDRYDEKGRIVALTKEDQAILNLAKLFVHQQTPAYAIATEEQRQAVLTFQKQFRKSTFLQVFDLKRKTLKTDNPRFRKALLENLQVTPICHYGEIKNPREADPNIIAHPFFYWMPHFNRLAHVYE